MVAGPEGPGLNVHKIVLTDENGEEVPFEKGLGTSGNATIVYDLTGYGALRFQAQIAIQSDNWWGGTSFTLKADGEEFFTQSLTSSRGITPVDVEIPEGTTILTMETPAVPILFGRNAQIICDRAVMDRLKTLSVQPEEPAVAVGIAPIW